MNIPSNYCFEIRREVTPRSRLVLELLLLFQIFFLIFRRDVRSNARFNMDLMEHGRCWQRGAEAAWAGSAPLSTPVSFLSLSNLNCSPEIKLSRFSADRFLRDIMSLIWFCKRAIDWSSGEYSRSWRCWRRSSSPCSIRTFLEKLLVIFVKKPRNTFPTD